MSASVLSAWSRGEYWLAMAFQLGRALAWRRIGLDGGEHRAIRPHPAVQPLRGANLASACMPLVVWLPIMSLIGDRGWMPWSNRGGARCGGKDRVGPELLIDSTVCPRVSKSIKDRGKPSGVSMASVTR